MSSNQKFETQALNAVERNYYANLAYSRSGAVVTDVLFSTLGGNVGETASAIWVGTSGNLQLEGVDGNTNTFTGVPVGVFRFKCKRVLSAGTTASDLTWLGGMS